MNRPIRLIVRLAALVAAIAVLQLLAAPPPAVSPYTSALSSLGPSAALAAPGCNNKTCEKDPRKGPTCFKAMGANCSVSGGCTSTTC